MRRTRTRSALFAFVVVALVASASAGCSSGKVLTARDVSKAIDATKAAGTAKIELTAKLDGVKGVPAAAADGIKSEGAIDFATGSGSLALDGKAAGLPNGVIELRFVDKTIYVQLPALFAGAAGGGQWISVTPATIDKSSGAAANLAQLGSFDPTTQLELLRSVSKPLRADGSEDVRGEKVTKYVGNVDLGKVVETRSALLSNIGGNDATRKALAGLEIPVAVYLDADGRIVRYTASIDLGAVARASGGTTTGNASVAVDFYDFGTAVDVAAPPPEQVTDGSTLLNSLGG